MSIKIKGITFFQKELENYQDGNVRWRNLFTKDIYKLLTERNIYTVVSKSDSRFKVDVEFVEFSKTLSIEPYTTFLRGNFFYSMGAFSYSRSNLPINTIVGRYSSIADGVRRMGVNHPTNKFTTSFITYEKNSIALNEYHNNNNFDIGTIDISTVNGKPIIIGNDVWIGQNVLISAKGISIGDGAIIAANTVLTKDVPPYAVVGGNPGKIIKFRFSPDIIEQLLELRWWQYDFSQFEGINVNDDIEIFIEKAKNLRADGRLVPFEPEPLTRSEINQVMFK